MSFVMLIYVRRGTAGLIFIQIMLITNKNICRIHNYYARLYIQGTPTSGANVSPDEGIEFERLL